MCEICSKLTIKTPEHHYSCLIKENSCPKNSIRMHNSTKELRSPNTYREGSICIYYEMLSDLL